jgi:hypothetical protein
MVRSSNGSGDLSVYSDCLCNGRSGVRMVRDSSACIVTVYIMDGSGVRMVRDSSACIVTVYVMDGQESDWFGIAQRV